MNLHCKLIIHSNTKNTNVYYCLFLYFWFIYFVLKMRQ